MNNGNEIQRIRKEEEKELNNGLEDLRYKITGNHTMVALDIEEDDVTLIIDPTNLGLGVYKDGKIIMFNEKDPDEATYRRCIIGEISYSGFKGLLGYPISYTKSFRESKLSLEQLEKKYGLKAQNEMLKKIEKEEKQQTVKEKYKIDKNVTYDFNRNVVTINKNKVLQKEER